MECGPFSLAGRRDRRRITGCGGTPPSSSAPRSPVAAGSCPRLGVGMGRIGEGAEDCLWRCRRGRGDLARGDWNSTFRRAPTPPGSPPSGPRAPPHRVTLAAATSATTKELMRRLGHSSPTAPLYQRAADDREARDRPRSPCSHGPQSCRRLARPWPSPATPTGPHEAAGQHGAARAEAAPGLGWWALVKTSSYASSMNSSSATSSTHSAVVQAASG